MKKLSLSTALFSLVLSFSLYAETSQNDKEEFHKAREACFDETGVTRPSFGDRPSDEERQKIRTCLATKGFDKKDRRHGRKHSKEKMAAFKECLTELNLPEPQKGERPSKENHEKIHACLKTKGLDIPTRD